VGCWRGYLSGARFRLAYGPADATATHCLLLSKIQIGLPFWYRLTRVVPEKGPLNGCVSVKWLAAKTASEMTDIVSIGALKSTPTNFEIRKWFTPSFVDNFLQDIPNWVI